MPLRISLIEAAPIAREARTSGQRHSRQLRPVTSRTLNCSHAPAACVESCGESEALCRVCTVQYYEYSRTVVPVGSYVCYQGLITLEEGTITEGLIGFRVELSC